MAADLNQHGGGVAQESAAALSGGERGEDAGNGACHAEAAQTVTPEQMDEWLEVRRRHAAVMNGTRILAPKLLHSPHCLDKWPHRTWLRRSHVHGQCLQGSDMLAPA